MVATLPAPARRPARGMAIYLLVSAVLLVGYAVTSTLLWVNRDFQDDGPLNFHHAALNNPDKPGASGATASLDPGTSLAAIERRCSAAGSFTPGPRDSIKIVAARIDGTAYYACYEISGGKVFDAVVIDAEGIKAPDDVIKDAGAWRWIGVVKTPGELVLGGVTLAVLLGLYWLYYRKVRPGPPVPARWWQGAMASAVLGIVLLLPFTLPFRNGESRARRMRLFFMFVIGWCSFIVIIFLLTSLGDRTSFATLGLITTGLLFGWIGGRNLLQPNGFGAPDGGGTMPGQIWDANRPAVLPPDATATTSGAGQRRARAGYVRPAKGLPTFADVGGMEILKDELADTFGLLLAFGNEADRYRITFNGLLLHGTPGVGKTFIARATAGEFGLSFAHVSTGDLISKYVGESSANIKAVFAEAARNVPCLLFFDEFDSIAERRDSGQSEESKRVVNQLLQSLEEWRPVRDLIIMAATNHVDRLDPAVVRPGRFDRHIRVDLPDLTARRAILAAQLEGRPTAGDVDLDDIAERTAGRTPATITRIVEAAAMSAFRQAAESGAAAPIRQADLRAALAGLGGTDRPTVEDWTWERLILPEQMKAELRQVQALVADPDLAKSYGVDVPSGLLLAGPPGTGKTTIARVLAAQTGFSFYPQTAADLTSKWVGESEASVVRLFARARENAPSIIFIDEIDAIAGTRSESGGSYLDRTLTQLLTEIDGMAEQAGVFVIAATNRPDMLDPALVRGGRLSRTITIPLPGPADRLRLLQVFSARMPLVDVDLGKLAERTEGLSGADLEALCQQAALRAMVAAQSAGAGDGASVVTPAAFAQALRDRAAPRPGSAADGGTAEIRTGEPQSGTGGYL